MAASTAWDDMFGGQTCTVATRASLSGYGVPAFSASASTYKCRWVEKRAAVVDSQGQTVAQRGLLWVMSTAVIDPTSKITLPDGTATPVLAVDMFSDEDGRFHHNRISCGY